MVEEYTVKNINPKSQAAKGLEMTVMRCLQLIEAFDALGEGEDWTDVPNATYRKIIGERYMFARMLEEVFNRYKSGRIYTEVTDLAANLPPAALERKEIKDGLHRISQATDSRSKGRAARTPTRRGR